MRPKHEIIQRMNTRFVIFTTSVTIDDQRRGKKASSLHIASIGYIKAGKVKERRCQWFLKSTDIVASAKGDAI